MSEIGMTLVVVLIIVFFILAAYSIAEKFSSIETKVSTRTSEIIGLHTEVVTTRDKIKTMDKELREINKDLLRLVDSDKELTERVDFLAKLASTLTKCNDALEKKICDLVDRVIKLEETDIVGETQAHLDIFTKRVASLDVRVSRLENMNDKITQALAPQNQPRVEWPKRELPRDLPPKAEYLSPSGQIKVVEELHKELPQADAEKKHERQCITHHHSCDCREGMMRKLVEVGSILVRDVESQIKWNAVDCTEERCKLIEEFKALKKNLGY